MKIYIYSPYVFPNQKTLVYLWIFELPTFKYPHLCGSYFQSTFYYSTSHLKKRAALFLDSLWNDLSPCLLYRLKRPLQTHVHLSPVDLWARDYGPQGIMFGLLRSLVSPEIKLDVLHTSNPSRVPDIQPQIKSTMTVCCSDTIFWYSKRLLKNVKCHLKWTLEKIATQKRFEKS